MSRRVRSLLTSAVLVAMVALIGCTDETTDDDRTVPTTRPTPIDQPDAIPVDVDVTAPVATVDERFLSVGLDQAQLLGGRFWDPDGEPDPAQVRGGSSTVDPYDLDRPRLSTLLGALAPAYLRVGGTASEEVWYDLTGDGAEPPEGYELVLDRERWSQINAFATEVGFDVTMTLNAGPGPRDEQGRWTPDQARSLIEHTVEEGYPVEVWSLGNEPNYFGVNFGGPGPEELAEDYVRFTEMAREADPDAQLAGPASAYWPGSGEIIEVTEPFLAAGGGRDLDLVTWHFYPQQSSRCAFARTPADPERALDPEFLDAVGAAAGEVAAARDAHVPDAELWLQETGNAQCGGQVGLSDRFAATFWWLDHLGQLARLGQQVVVRWNVSGADYGLLREPDLEPNPDYWASLLWRRVMGTTVLRADPPADRPLLRTYAHCHPEGDGAVTVLVQNLDRDAPATVGLPGLEGPREQYLLTAPDLLGREVELNGTPLELVDGDSLPELTPVELDGSLELPAASMAFVVLPEAQAESCR